MTDDDYTEPTKADEAEVKALEAKGDTRSTAQSERLQDLYLAEYSWRVTARKVAKQVAAVALVVVDPLKKAISGSGRKWLRNTRKPKGSPLLIIPIVPSTKWSLVSAIGSVTTLIAMEFTPSELTAFGIVAGLLTSLFASVTSIIIARQGKAVAIDAKAAISENTKITEKTSADVEKVKSDVDGIKTRDAARIAELMREAETLKQQLAKAEERALLLASKVSPTAVLASPAPSGVEPSTGATLVKMVGEAATTAAETAERAAASAAATEVTLKQVEHHTANTATAAAETAENTKRTDERTADAFKDQK